MYSRNRLDNLRIFDIPCAYYPPAGSSNKGYMDIQIQFPKQQAFKSSAERTRFAQFLGQLTSTLGETPFQPYQMNQSDRAWVIDRGNDWFLMFSDDDACVATIRHRYGNEEAARALAGWAAYRYGGKVTQAV